MREGDKNTKFFLVQCNEMRQHNFIKGIRDEHGVWQTEKSRATDVAIDYFQKFFTSSNPHVSSILGCLEGMEGVINEESNNQLLKDFTSSEVSQSLKQMYPTKAPSPDGMSAIFLPNLLGDCWP